MDVLFRSKLLAWIFFGIVILCQACKSDNSPITSTAFYYWKTHYQLNAFEKKYLQSHQVKKIALRFFDVIVEDGIPTPESVLIFDEPPLPNTEYMPVVFIENQVFNQIDSAGIQVLQQHIWKLCTQIAGSQKLSIQTIQFDCDWTIASRDKFFYFLHLMKQMPCRVSSTLRLYQYKYRTQCGIPPVDEVTLMCYNMGNLKKFSANNSILNMHDLEAYTQTYDSYPRPMNIALPIFQWYVIFRNNAFYRLSYHHPKFDTLHWQCIEPNQYLCKLNTTDTANAMHYLEGDIIKKESIEPNSLSCATSYIFKHIHTHSNEIIYFDLDSAHIRACLQP